MAYLISPIIRLITNNAVVIGRRNRIENRETGIRTNEIGLIIKTEIGLMEIGLILFSAALELMEIGLKQLLAWKNCN